MPSSGIKTGAFVNGQWQDQPTIGINDSGLSYGLALFETMRVVDGQIPLLAGHLSRLSRSLSSFCIPAGAIDAAMSDLAALISSQQVSNAVVRLTITAGQAERGYALSDARRPSRIIQLFPTPASGAAIGVIGLAETRLSPNPLLAGIKHSNRIEQVLGKQELNKQQQCDDLLLQDRRGNVIEAISSNLFAVHGDILSTPELSECGVDGVMRSRAMERLKVKEQQFSINTLRSADELLLSNALGVKRVKSLSLAGDLIRFEPTPQGDQLIGVVPW